MKTIAFLAAGLLAISAITSVHAAGAKENWEKNCMQCHGKTGAADTKMGKVLNAKDLSDPKVQAGFTDAEAATAIKNGLKENGKTKMKGFGDKLSDAEVKAMVAYVRTLKK
jgi:mono/diheme cytochrome c family protein